MATRLEQLIAAALDVSPSNVVVLDEDLAFNDLREAIGSRLSKSGLARLERYRSIKSERIGEDVAFKIATDVRTDMMAASEDKRQPIEVMTFINGAARIVSWPAVRDVLDKRPAWQSRLWALSNFCGYRFDELGELTPQGINAEFNARKHLMPSYLRGHTYL